MTAVDIPAIRALIEEARTTSTFEFGSDVDSAYGWSELASRLADALDSLLALVPEPAKCICDGGAFDPHQAHPFLVNDRCQIHGLSDDEIARADRTETEVLEGVRIISEGLIRVRQAMVPKAATENETLSIAQDVLRGYGHDAIADALAGFRRPRPLDRERIAEAIIDAAWDDGPHPDSITALAWSDAVIAALQEGNSYD